MRRAPSSSDVRTGRAPPPAAAASTRSMAAHSAATAAALSPCRSPCTGARGTGTGTGTGALSCVPPPPPQRFCYPLHQSHSTNAIAASEHLREIRASLNPLQKPSVAAAAAAAAAAPNELNNGNMQLKTPTHNAVLEKIRQSLQPYQAGAAIGGQGKRNCDLAAPSASSESGAGAAVDYEGHLLQESAMLQELVTMGFDKVGRPPPAARLSHFLFCFGTREECAEMRCLHACNSWPYFVGRVISHWFPKYDSAGPFNARKNVWNAVDRWILFHTKPSNNRSQPTADIRKIREAFASLA